MNTANLLIATVIRRFDYHCIVLKAASSADAPASPALPTYFLFLKDVSADQVFYCGAFRCAVFNEQR